MFPALKFDNEEEEEGQLIWEASRPVASLPPLGRVLTTIFNAEWRSVEKALSSSSDAARPQQGAVLDTQSFSPLCVLLGFRGLQASTFWRCKRIIFSSLLLDSENENVVD